MKINCYEIKVDINELRKGIDKFYCMNYKKPSYLVMNHNTKNKMRSDLVDAFYYYCINYKSNTIDKFMDIPIAINEGLEDGEVDIV